MLYLIVFVFLCIIVGKDVVEYYYNYYNKEEK